MHLRTDDGGHDGFEAGGSFGGNRPLSVGKVALAPHAQVAIEPWLLFDPGDGVQAIFGFVKDGFKFTAGVKHAARRLDKDVVAALGKARVGEPHPHSPWAHVCAASVNAADEERGERARRVWGVVIGF